VQKGFSIIGGIILTAMLRWAFVNAPLTTELCLAAPLTLLATYIRRPVGERPLPSKRLRRQRIPLGVSAGEIIAVDALPKDNEGDLILRTLSVLPAALSTNVMACLPREQRLVLAIDLDMLVVWSFEPATIALMAGTSHKRLQQPSRASGLGQVSVKGLNSEYPVCVRLRRGASEFVHRAAQAYDVGVISTKLSRSMVAAIARSVDGGGGAIAFVRGNDDIGLGQDYSSIVPRDRGEIIVLSDDK
ncbi:hypothetical protein FOZ63_033479, partial [Perkinsus olseni]